MTVPYVTGAELHRGERVGPDLHPQRHLPGAPQRITAAGAERGPAPQPHPPQRVAAERSYRLHIGLIGGHQPGLVTVEHQKCPGVCRITLN